MFKELENVDNIEISHDSFIEENNGENSSDFHLELVDANFPEQSNSSPLRKCPKPAKILYF